MGVNATTFVPAYTSGEVLTAADLTVTNSGAPVFADAAARDAAFGGTGEKVLAEGQLAYLEDSNVVQYYDGAAWATVGPAAASGVVQVKSTTKTDTFTMSSTTFADVTGLSVAITPTSATNKIFVVATMNTGNNIAALLYARLLRDSTDVALGDTAGSRTQVTGSVYSTSSGETQPLSMSFLDSPATTSALTYKVQIAGSGAALMAVNRSDDDNNNANRSRGSSTITVFEVTP